MKFIIAQIITFIKTFRFAELKENNIHDPNSPLLYGRLDEMDKITERKVKSLIRSSNLWDFS